LIWREFIGKNAIKKQRCLTFQEVVTTIEGGVSRKSETSPFFTLTLLVAESHASETHLKLKDVQHAPAVDRPAAKIV
jgi:hypothetical protein